MDVIVGIFFIIMFILLFVAMLIDFALILFLSSEAYDKTDYIPVVFFGVLEFPIVYAMYWIVMQFIGAL